MNAMSSSLRVSHIKSISSAQSRALMASHYVRLFLWPFRLLSVVCAYTRYG